LFLDAFQTWCELAQHLPRLSLRKGLSSQTLHECVMTIRPKELVRAWVEAFQAALA